MIPRDFIEIASMPTNGNGKVDRNALKEIFKEQTPKDMMAASKIWSQFLPP